MIEVPTSDIDFYERKIVRLEIDLGDLQDELSSARMRLRTAEDFQIKYDLLLRQSQQENHRLKQTQRAEDLKKSEILQNRVAETEAKWEKKLKDVQHELNRQFEERILRMEQEKTQEIKKIQEQSEKTQRIELLQFKFKKSQSEKKALEQQLDDIKIFYQKQRSDDLSALRESLTSKTKEKQTTDKNAYESQINELEQAIRNLQVDLAAKQIEERPRNFDKLVCELKEQLSKQKDAGAEELQEISSTLRDKNEEIERVIGDKIVLESTIQSSRKQHREYAKMLENKLFEKEKDHDIELINLKERMSKIREEEIEQLKLQNGRTEDIFNVERHSWDMIIGQKQSEREKLKHAFDQQRNRWREDKIFLKKKIQELKERLREADGTREMGETDQLLNSLRDFENREDHFSTYENGITFLERQLKKAIVKLQQKNLEVKKLLKDIGLIHSEFDKQQENTRQKVKKEKKDLNEKILKLESYSRELNETIREKDLQIKKTIRDDENKRSMIQAEKKSLKQFNEELQRDYNRVIENKKSIESSYREERQKSIVSKSDFNLSRKDKWLELEKQKNELNVIYKEKEEQFKAIHEAERNKLSLERDKLKQENSLLKHAKQLQDQEMKMFTQDKENSRASRMANFSKKMATVDLELSLTQNLLNSLSEAKSRMKQPIEEIEEAKSGSQPDENLKKEFDSVPFIDGLELEDGEASPAFRRQPEDNAGHRHLLESFGPMMAKRNN